MFAWRSDTPGLTRAVTDRWGGVSTGRFAELNLGPHVGDTAAAVAENRSRVTAALDLEPGRLVFMRQVHGRVVAEVTDPGRVHETEADALVTRSPDLGLAVMVADCLPVLLADEEAGVVAVAHIGRAGLREGLLAETIAAMRDLGATAVHGTLGPGICAGCYEVSQKVHDEVTAVIPRASARSTAGTPALDIPSGAIAQLAALGVSSTGGQGCPRELPGQFSYRRDGRTGRFAGIVVRRSA